MTHQERVAKAVADPEWQKFRLSLKGLQTEEKLRKLTEYFGDERQASPPKAGYVYIRVDNYLKALARGGQIAPTADYVNDLLNGKLKVQK